MSGGKSVRLLRLRAAALSLLSRLAEEADEQPLISERCSASSSSEGTDWSVACLLGTGLAGGPSTKGPRFSEAIAASPRGGRPLLPGSGAASAGAPEAAGPSGEAAPLPAAGAGCSASATSSPRASAKRARRCFWREGEQGVPQPSMTEPEQEWELLRPMPPGSWLSAWLQLRTAQLSPTAAASAVNAAAAPAAVASGRPGGKPRAGCASLPAFSCSKLPPSLETGSLRGLSRSKCCTMSATWLGGVAGGCPSSAGRCSGRSAGMRTSLGSGSSPCCGCCCCLAGGCHSGAAAAPALGTGLAARSVAVTAAALATQSAVNPSLSTAVEGAIRRLRQQAQHICRSVCLALSMAPSSRATLPAQKQWGGAFHKMGYEFVCSDCNACYSPRAEPSHWQCCNHKGWAKPAPVVVPRLYFS